MHLPQQISYPFQQHDEATNSGGASDATSPVPSRPPERERRKSKFLEEGMLDDDKLKLRSGEDTSTFDSIISPPARASEQVADESGLAYRNRKSKWKREDPFGEEQEAEANYKTMTWWQAALVMAAEIISFGIFGLPSALDVLGIVPGVILIVGSGVLSTYTGHVLWRFRTAHPFVDNMADVGDLLGGRLVRDAMGIAQLIFLVFTMGRHILFFNICFNKLTNHATCTIAWAVLAFFISFVLTTPRTLRTVSYFALIALISIIATAVITMISIGIHHPSSTHLRITTHTSLATAFLPVASIIFSYSAHITFFAIISELREPQDFPKALFASQTGATLLYVVVGVVIYRYTGDNVGSLAIDNARPLPQKIAYGLALPTVVVAGAIYAHIAAKAIYARLFRGTRHKARRPARLVTCWLLIVLALWTIAFVIAESIPGFGYLFSLICSIFTSWFTYGLAGVLWLFLHGGIRRHQCLWALLNLAIVVMAAGMIGLGVYSSGKAMHEDEDEGSWSCADTSSSAW